MKNSSVTRGCEEENCAHLSVRPPMCKESERQGCCFCVFPNKMRRMIAINSAAAVNWKWPAQQNRTAGREDWWELRSVYAYVQACVCLFHSLGSFYKVDRVFTGKYYVEQNKQQVQSSSSSLWLWKYPKIHFVHVLIDGSQCRVKLLLCALAAKLSWDVWSWCIDCCPSGFTGLGLQLSFSRWAAAS